MEDASNAPKFHLDRSRYGEALLQWFTDSHTDHKNIAIGEIDIPVATGFSNETVLFTTKVCSSRLLSVTSQHEKTTF